MLVHPNGHTLIPTSWTVVQAALRSLFRLHNVLLENLLYASTDSGYGIMAIISNDDEVAMNKI